MSVTDLIKAMGNPDASPIDKSEVYKPKDFYDTGNLMINAMFSGSVKRGIPSGMMYGLAGPQASGKTSIAVYTIVNFLKTHKNGIVIYQEYF